MVRLRTMTLLYSQKRIQIFLKHASTVFPIRLTLSPLLIVSAREDVPGCSISPLIYTTWGVELSSLKETHSWNCCSDEICTTCPPAPPVVVLSPSPLTEA